MPTKNGLYPNTLFHFTTLEGLLGILKDNFRLSYSKETIHGQEVSKQLGVPMVSFCDLRLSELNEHMNCYGQFGIGLSKSWANSSGLNPVFYMNTASPVTDRLLLSINDFYDILEEQQDIASYAEMIGPYYGVLNLLRYVKNYEGTLLRKNLTPKENFRFANEREWRYVPPFSDDIPPLVPAKKLDDMDFSKALKKTVSHHSLKFHPSDINYLVIKSDKHRIKLLEHLRQVKGGYSQDEVRVLSSKIITAEQIRSDV